MALHLVTGDQWRWLSMRQVLDAWEAVTDDIEATDLFHLLSSVSEMPLDTLPGDPFPASRPDSLVRTLRGRGLEIAFVVVTPAETAYGLRLANIRPL